MESARGIGKAEHTKAATGDAQPKRRQTVDGEEALWQHRPCRLQGIPEALACDHSSAKLSPLERCESVNEALLRLLLIMSPAATFTSVDGANAGSITAGQT